MSDNHEGFRLKAVLLSRTQLCNTDLETGAKNSCAGSNTSKDFKCVVKMTVCGTRSLNMTVRKR
jgi:hypothetical protein